MTVPDVLREAAAAAIWRADCPAAAAEGHTFDDLSENGAHKLHYRRLADAVLLALQLTQEFSVVTDMGVWGKNTLKEENARRLAEMYDDMELRVRFVGPWSTGHPEEQR